MGCAGRSQGEVSGRGELLSVVHFGEAQVVVRWAERIVVATVFPAKLFHSQSPGLAFAFACSLDCGQFHWIPLHGDMPAPHGENGGSWMVSV